MVRARRRWARGAAAVTRASATGATVTVVAVLPDPPDGSPRAHAARSASSPRRRPKCCGGGERACRVGTPLFALGLVPRPWGITVFPLRGLLAPLRYPRRSPAH